MFLRIKIRGNTIDEELIKALRLIQEECLKHEGKDVVYIYSNRDVEFYRDCKNCPMYSKRGPMYGKREGCILLFKEPSYWTIPETTPKKVEL